MAVVQPRALAEDARLLHIGFRKCGTSALQSTLREARPDLAALGVVYPGGARNHTAAALAVTKRTNGWVSRGAKPTPMRYWLEMVDEVAQLSGHQRAVMSSEFFDIADEATIRTIASGLGADRVHIVATVRPLHHVLPSSWQQNIQYGIRRSYEEWLRLVFDGDPSDKVHRGFWERHRHDQVLTRWAEVLGPERVTLIVLDSEDRQLPFRSFEVMLGLPSGTLNEVSGQTNRSLTLAEAELIRRVNLELFSRDISWHEYTQLIRFGASQQMWGERKPGDDEPRIKTPSWATNRAAEIAEDLPKRIQELGIEVVGDLATLAPPAPEDGSGEATDEPETVPMDAAVHAIVGACLGSRKVAAPQPARQPKQADPTELTARELAQLLRRYAKRKWRRFH